MDVKLSAVCVCVHATITRSTKYFTYKNTNEQTNKQTSKPQISAQNLV